MKSSVQKLSSRVSVETPEQIDFTFEVAHLGPRILAYLIDLAIRVFSLIAISTVVVMLTGGAPFGFGIVAVISFFVEWGYFTLFEWLWDGKTPGKKVVNLKVVRLNGASVDLTRCAMRNLLRVADGFPPLFAVLGLFPVPSYAVGILMIFTSAQGRRIGDFVADTMVVVEEKATLDEPLGIFENHMVVKREQLPGLKLTARDLSMIDSFFRRKPRLSVERFEEVASILAEPIAVRLGIEKYNSEKLLAGVLAAGNSQRALVSRLEENMEDGK